MVGLNGSGQRRRRRRSRSGKQRGAPAHPRPSNNNMRREERSFDEGRALFKWRDLRPPLTLWTAFVNTITEQLGSIARDMRNEMRGRAEMAAQHYPQDVETWWRRAKEWNEISFETPDALTLFIAAGPSIRLECRLKHGTVDVQCVTLPEGEERIRPFNAEPRSSREAQHMAKAKTEIIAKLVCRHLDPVAQTVELLKQQEARPKTIEPDWWRDGGSRQSTRGR